MWQFFKHLVFPSHCLSQTPFNPKSLFTQTPAFSSKNLCKITSMYVFLNIVFIFVLDYADFSLGFRNLGIFKKRVGVPIFWKKISKFWLGWVLFTVFVSVLALWGILIMYWGIFHHGHAFFIGVVFCFMLGVWQNVLVTFLCWIGLKWVPLLGFTLVCPCLTCFGQWMCVPHTLYKLCLNAMPCTH